MKHGQQLTQSIATLRQKAAALTPGAFDAAVLVLSSHEWGALEASYWNSSHPLPIEARNALNAYLEIAKIVWHKSGLGQAEPLALYKTTLQSKQSIETALRVLAKIYAGCNLGYGSPPMGFWRTVYALTGYLVSDSYPDRGARATLLNQAIQLWLMAWLNPLSLPPGHLPVAVRLVGILSKICSFTLTSPTHAGSGLAVADLMSDSAPMSFSRVPAVWEPAAPLYINAQDAAFTIRELSTPGAVNKPRDAYDSLLQSGQQVGLSALEMQNFVRSAMRKFAYSNSRSIPRVGRNESVKVVVGLIEVWSALQEQTKTSASGVSTRDAYTSSAATIINHSEGGFLLQFAPGRPLLCVESLLCLRGGDADPWTVAAVRWLDDSSEVMLAGCEVICNFAQARIAQASDGGQHLPVVAYQSGDATSVLIPRDASATTAVTQLSLDDEAWVITAAADIGEDWQRSTVLDVIRTANLAGQK
jgi:hypothetical protein